jgi:hypothetical protein
LHTVPHSIEDALKYDVRETQQQVHSGTGAPGVRGKEGAVFHGQSIGLDDAHKRVLEYFRQVNRGVRGLLKGPWAPLVLAGVEELVPIYKQANTYPNLVEQSIEGNPDRMNASELHKAAQDALRLYFEEARKQAVEHYRAAIGTAKASNALPELLIGAYHGRLEFALISPCAERWGRFDPEQDTVEIHDAPQTGDEDLVNAVAIHTILNHGAVYAVAPQDIPGAAPVAAVFRYPVGTITDTAEVYAGEEVQP